MGMRVIAIDVSHPEERTKEKTDPNFVTDRGCQEEAV
jgi:hypothetical protein